MIVYTDSLGIGYYRAVMVVLAVSFFMAAICMKGKK